MNQVALRRAEPAGASPSITRAETPSRRSPAPPAARWGRLAPTLFALIVLLVLYHGWQDRDSLRITAENGVGYALGIIGGSLMLVMLLYPARKRLAFMRRLGPVKWWFRSHMMFGIIGPVLILYHCNFHLGSLNSNVSLLCMLLVTSSGLIGRYFYSKLHHGLYGRRATVQELRENIALLKDQSAYALPAESLLARQLHALEAATMSGHRSLWGSALRITAYNLRSHWLQINLPLLLKSALRRVAARSGVQLSGALLKAERRRLSDYLTALRKVNQLAFYERLFSLWHVLHFPLFLMLVISGIVHVIAVHLY